MPAPPRRCRPVSTLSSTRERRETRWSSGTSGRAARAATSQGRRPVIGSPSKVTRPAARPLEAGDHVEGGGLARAVRPDQARDPARAHLEATAGERGAHHRSRRRDPASSAGLTASAMRGATGPRGARCPAAGRRRAQRRAARRRAASATARTSASRSASGSTVKSTRADHGAEQRPLAAGDDHDDHRHRVGEQEDLGADEARVVRVEPARHPGHRRADHGRQHQVCVASMPTDSARVSFSRSATKRSPDARARRVAADQIRGAGGDQHQVVVGGLGPQAEARAAQGAGTPGRPSGPLVRSIQFTLTSEITPAKLMVTSTKYAPRSLRARRPIAQPVSAGGSAAAADRARTTTPASR